MKTTRVPAALALLVAATATAFVGVGQAQAHTTTVTAPAVPAQRSAGHTLIQGSGSSWAANAINQWISDVNKQGLQVVFTSSGSATGRKDFASKTVDYAVSDVGYQGEDSTTNSSDNSQGRSFAYLPIVAGGTSFPYQLHGKGGALIRNLRLSGPTLLGIFTGSITYWDDAAIKSDNNGDPQRQLPHLQIIPVVHAEGSGSTYQFTKYLDTEYGSRWESFAGGGATEYFPSGKGNEVSESGSDAVINFLTSKAGNGAIGYDEYSYALAKDYPVAKVLNSGGYYTLPNQYNVAVAMQAAIINSDASSKDYLLQDLHDVYTYGDARTYPLSSYSYMIIPVAANDSKVSSAGRQTIADYVDYSVCQGQAEMGPIGYSPLTLNLVQGSFDQVKKLHEVDSTVDVSQADPSKCNNPTFVAGNTKANRLAQIAPPPEACDKQGAGPCLDAGNTGQANPDANGKVATTGAGSSGSGSVSAAGGGSAGGASGNGAAGTVGVAGGTSADTADGTGADGSADGTGPGGATATTTSAVVRPQSAAFVPVAIVAGLVLLGIIAGPPLVGATAARGKR